MANTVYSGAAIAAATGRFKSRPPVAGVNPDHSHPDPEPDPFNPAPDVDRSAGPGTIWGYDDHGAGQSGQPNLAQAPVSHWFPGLPAVPSNVPYGRGQQEMQNRLIIDHMPTSYVPDGVRLYQHATEGVEVQWLIGRMPRDAGATIPDGPLAGLQNGRNSYDAINQPNEVYAGDPANVGRYRLGVKTNLFGVYDNPAGKFGQDALLHAYTGLQPAFPADKPPMQNTAPYTPNSTGTSHWFPAASNQVPSLFGLPSETAMTDFGVAAEDYRSDFADDDGYF
jgi:hypothetical protein